jgi:hypothetical protein
MTMPRCVTDETLDHLAEDDPRARRSRRDLRRVHMAMGTRRILRRGLQTLATGHRGAPLRILELGAGDGTLMLGVAQARLPCLAHAEFTMLDRQGLVSEATIAGYGRAGWVATTQIADVLDWARESSAPSRRWDLIVANLFMHHFESSELDLLLRAIEARCSSFFACEPRRSWPALAGSHLVGLLGANAVTRQDAVLSVHAGFRDQELSRAWPGPPDAWALREHAAGLFSHCFSACRGGVG